jgi:mannobiose 2-epimerase
MNTHLHILEAYTNLYRVWKDQRLEKQLKNLVRIFLDLIIDPVTSHLNLFFDEEWKCKSAVTSYGHDIECSWLLTEAAEVLNDAILLAEVKSRCMAFVEAANEGYHPMAASSTKKNNVMGHEDRDRHWWPHSEAVVGYLNA